MSYSIYWQFLAKTEIRRLTPAGTAGDLEQLVINKAVENFNKKLKACRRIKAGSGHFEFLQLPYWQTVSYVVRITMFFSARKNRPPFVLFSVTNILDTTGQQMIVQFLTSSNVCFCTTSAEQANKELGYIHI